CGFRVRARQCSSMSDRASELRPGQSSMLFDPLVAAGPVAEHVGDAAWLRAMLDFEAALAAAQADAGLIDRLHAERIERACHHNGHDDYDIAELGRAARGAGNPAAPLVRAITERVEGAAARYVHWGATSQDVVDTAAMLVAARARMALLADVEACTETLAELADEHAATVQVARTLSQHALPTTFGLVAAGWLTSLDTAAERLQAVRLPVQFGGAVGTLASLGESGVEVLAALAARLGLAEPALPWHTDRTPVAELAGALGGLAGAVSGVARS